MAFIDELRIHARAGKGGDGVVRWRHEKFRPLAGPSGGDGGNGGDVIAVGVRDIHLLSKYRTQRDFVAENGGEGQKESLHGKNGEHEYIKLPIGSYIKNTANGKKYELLHEGQEITLLRGGIGGYGNEHFKSSTNRSPQESTPGTQGGEADFEIELRLFADVGLVGLPNAGKTSLLNEITRANGKVGDYPFTTLEPNLGEMYGFIIADIPGLIEGASEGKGLGQKFLRHIRRTKVLAHLVSLENEDPLQTYMLVRKELAGYGNGLEDKRELVILSKTDLVSSEVVAATAAAFKKEGLHVETLSAYDDDSVKRVREALIETVQKD
jgi:GTP-binding protein